jgi:hypothetical protein
VSDIPQFGNWFYNAPDERTLPGDQRCICTFEQDGMVWVGIAIWTGNFRKWLQNGTPITGHVLGWMPLPEPARGRWVRGILVFDPKFKDIEYVQKDKHP